MFAALLWQWHCICDVDCQQHVDIEWVTVVSSVQLIGWAKVVSSVHLLFDFKLCPVCS